MKKRHTMPFVGDWIPVDSKGHTGRVLAITPSQGIINATVYVGINDPLCTEVEIPYYASIDAKYAAAVIGVDTIPSDTHMVLAVSAEEFYPRTDSMSKGLHLEVGHYIPIHENGGMARIYAISETDVTVEAKMGEVGKGLFSGCTFCKVHTECSIKYCTTMPLALYSSWHTRLFFFTPGMHIRIGYGPQDVGKVVRVNRKNPRSVAVTIAAPLEAASPILVWSAGKYDTEKREFTIDSMCLYNWIHSTVPDVLPEMIESSTTFTGYSKLVPPAMQHSAADEIVEVAININRAVNSEAPLAEQERYMGQMLFHLMQLINAYGLDPQNVATQSLANRTN